MADHVNQVYRNDTMFSENTYRVKEEQCQEDNFIEDKVCISETGIIINNPVVQDHIWHCKIEQHEQPTCSNNIKTELAWHEVTEVQNDTVDIEEGMSADDVKIKFDNGLLYCENCEANYVDYCIGCGMLVNILNKNTLISADNGAPADIPNDILEIQDRFGQTGIYALRTIPASVKFGPFTGLVTTECFCKMKRETFVLDRNKSQYLNWMQYVNPTRNTSERNLHILQYEDNIYFQSTCEIQAGDKLLVYFGEEYGSGSNEIVGVEFATSTEDISKDVFACTFCCLGFSSKLLLVKHKTVCVENTAEKFSVEEVEQCPFCKIHLDRKEYYEHHMSFCCERNARKSILSMPPTKEATTVLHGCKRCLRKIYKCEQYTYRANYQTELKQYIKQHYGVKIYKCGTHGNVGGREHQEHSTTDHYRSTHIKVEESSSQDQKKTLKCDLCVFRTKYKNSLRRHMKTKHLKEMDYNCDSCEYRTNRKDSLEKHRKTKHFKKLDYNCDSCEYRTNRKDSLEKHRKTKHFKKLDYNCDSCEYRTGRKDHLQLHIKIKHLKKFDYSCDSCEYGTDRKDHLELHIKTKHLKKFDYICDSCEYGTNHKDNLELHIKTKHLKELDYNCDSCEYGTNRKDYLELHIKTKHLKKFDYSCDSCEYGTNRKNRFKSHVQTKHLKKYDYKCNSCEYGTNNKSNLELHIKTKHLKQFDYKCESCEFQTNLNNVLKRHIKTVHLNEFDFKCDLCEYRSNRKDHLELHIKSKHLKNSIINDF